jgi:hypothetical protein
MELEKIQRGAHVHDYFMAVSNTNKPGTVGGFDGSPLGSLVKMMLHTWHTNSETPLISIDK